MSYRFVAGRGGAVAAAVVVALLAGAPALGQGGDLDARWRVTLEVDATGMARHLLTARMSLPATPGRTNAYWYPMWIPGIHGPGEQIRNIAGLTFETAGGERLAWRRDPTEAYRFLVDVPAGADRVVASLTYLANQPTRISGGVDSYGNGLLGIVSFNTCVLYPEGAAVWRIPVEASVRLPAGWRWGSALRRAGGEQGATDGGGVAGFETVSLETLIDSPLIAGEHFRTIDIGSGVLPRFEMHLVSESPAGIAIGDDRVAIYRRLVAEAGAMFGGAPFDRYDMLVVCSDEVPNIGLEHQRSSLNAVGERDLVDEDRQTGWSAYLLPHEMVHAWCGKHRRPAGMVTDDYHTPKDTRQLWVYEGLTQYLGEVLSVRCGLVTPEAYHERLAGKIGYLAGRGGRSWRSLEDTANAGHTLRGGSDHWNDLRRDQDYYNEGLLLWMEIDATIRLATDGARSLDDFCRAFFDGSDVTERGIKPYDRAELIAALSRVADEDWGALIEARIGKPLERLPLDVVDRIGYRLDYTAERPAEVMRRERHDGNVSAEESIGMRVGGDGEVQRVLPGSVADAAGLAEGMRVVAVDGLRFTSDRLREAIEASVETGRIGLLAFEGERVVSFELGYDGGPRYRTLVAEPDRPDVLGRILEPEAGDPDGP